jgi:hypothetical protein
MYDIFNIAVRPANTILLGVKRPFPFAPFGMDDEGHSPGLSSFVIDRPEGESGSWMKWLSWLSWIDRFGIVKTIVPIVELVVSTLATWGVSVKADVIGNLQKIGGQSASLISAVSDVNPSIERGQEKTNKLVENAKMGHLAENSDPINPSNHPAPSAPPQQGGGSRAKDKSTLDYFAFAVIISVLLLSAGRTILNVGKTEVSSAGDLPRKNDVPPRKSRYV